MGGVRLRNNLLYQLTTPIYKGIVGVNYQEPVA